MKLWKKGSTAHQKVDLFTVGKDREYDLYLAEYDCQASIAHAKMLGKIGILSNEEVNQLTSKLNEIKIQAENKSLTIEDEFEDIHSKIEHILIKNLGDLGKKIHTARSRNDQVLVALHLYCKNELNIIKDKIIELFEVLTSLAEKHEDHLLPGYTHFQVAMPSSFGLWFSSYAELLVDDVYLLDAAIKTTDQNPLGSAAGYGSSFPIDRKFTTRELGFGALKYNVIAAQMGRGKNERTIAAALGGIANTLSRFSMDICMYMSQNFDFIAFPDSLVTGSSIMPHKKNPDVFELIRGKSNKIQALQTEMILITNNLPSGYHRDFQLLKENMINLIEEMKIILEIFNFSIQQIKVKKIDFRDEKYKYLSTVDSINDLVMKGLSFRDAYQQIGALVTNGTYEYVNSKEHTHIGSIHNLCLEAIREKFPK